MNLKFRSLAMVLLCLALVASSVTMAVARSQAAAMSAGVFTAEICSGYGVTTITLDADGNPVGPVHPCPDCLAGLAAYLPPSLPQPLAAGQKFGKAVVDVRLVLPRLTAVLLTRARGPPALV